MAGLRHALASFVALLSLSSYVTASPVEARGAQLPVVDLGYVVQRATEFNNTGRYYNFSNIRYAAPPTGNLRWRAPQPPAKNRAKVDTGSQKRICPQATVGWETYGENFVISTLLGVPFTQTVPLKQDFTNITLPAADPRVTEDCLFLDVFVPEEIFANADNCGKPNTGAPVLVWIFGGGYVEGDKTASGSPSGLLARSEAAPNDGGVIYVAMNYRLGAFGFMAGNEIKSNGIANAGLLDQRFALEWVQNNIHKFGGDPRRVTVFGESAGGGSIVHQLTAYGGAKGRVPFHQAVPQSPGWVPAISPKQQDAAQQGFFKLAGVSSFKEARAASTETLMTANYRQIYNSFYGTFTYGPVTDGVFVPEQPMHLLKVGDFDRSVKVMVGHNADEGLAFTPPNAANETVWDEFLAQTLPLASQATLDHISNTVYPPKYDGSQGYTNPIGRAATAIAELVFTCNTYYLEEAFNGKTYSYEFAVPPAIHGQDVGWTYFTGTDKTPNAKPSALNPYAITNVTVAIALQEFITSFAEKGVPEAMPGIPKFVTYGKDARIEILNSTGVTTGTDDVSKTRCQFWQSGAFLGKNPWKNDPER